MSKIVCDICGTTYPETATQCPICGSARPADAQPVEQSSNVGGYTYVKGGRFSKANVRKRNSGKEPAKVTPKAPKTADKPAKKTEVPAAPKKEKKSDSDNNRGLIITAIVLLVAVIAVVGYIAARYFFVPESEGAANMKDTIPCASVSVDVDEIELDLNSENKTAELKVTPTPTNTTDKITFASSDAKIATVDENGKITAHNVGNVAITVSCGSKKIVIQVAVVDSTEKEDLSQLRFLSPTYTMTLEGETCTLYTKEIGGIDPSEITWTTENGEIVTIDNGVVTAVANGTATVYGEYKDVKFSCIITVNFDGEDANGGNVGEDDGNTGVGEDDGNTGVGEDDNNGTPAESIHFCTLWSSASLTEFTIGYNESITLLVKDNNGNTVDATITVEDEGVVTVSGNVVTYVSGPSGVYTTITATYNGLTATCMVRR